MGKSCPRVGLARWVPDFDALEARVGGSTGASKQSPSDASERVAYGRFLL